MRVTSDLSMEPHQIPDVTRQQPLLLLLLHLDEDEEDEIRSDASSSSSSFSFLPESSTEWPPRGGDA